MDLQPRHFFTAAVFAAYIVMLVILANFDVTSQKVSIALMMGGAFILLLLAVYSFLKDRKL